jgi:murein DD-endopeptidase MepM/ murein hydrolase activator NlpD
MVAAGTFVALFAAPTGEADRAASGGAQFVPQPRIKSVKCRTGCISHGRVRSGGTVRLRGSELGATKKVVFLGGDGSADDAVAKVSPTSNESLLVKVPYAADSGPLSAWASRRARSKPSRSLTIVPAPPPPQTGKLKSVGGPADPGGPSVKTAVSSGVAIVGGRGVSFSYRIDRGGPADVSVALVDVSDGSALRNWTEDGIAPGDVRTITWNGRASGKPAHDGRYAFRMTATGPTGAASRNATDRDQTRDAFDLHGYVFPLHAHHTYGDGFGAPRSGHRHEGQDVFASCGTPILAPRGGTVKDNKFQSAAGNYLVIDGAGTGRDFFFAHLRKASPLEVGDRVYSGQRIGAVGDTGDAVGCHLHFEMWSAPGWYSGGHPFDPAPYLRAWDRYS